MKELDFDELDRAVNSLMTDAPRSDPPKNDDDVRTVTLDSSRLSPSNRSSDKVDDKSTPGATPEATPTPASSDSEATPASPAASSSASTDSTRKPGRFMDVVHKSSDMKQPSSSTATSRQGKTIEPSPDATSSPEPQPAPTPKPAPAPEEPAVSQTKEPAVEDASSANEWPDPIDAYNDTQKEKDSDDTKPETTPEVESQTEEPPVASPAGDTAPPADQAPLTTPFIAGAKVEKRPLGGAEDPNATPVSTPDLSLSDTGKESTKDTTPSEPEPSVDMPPELSGDIVAIEAAGSAANEKTTPADSVKPEPEAPKAAEAPKAKPTAMPTPSSAPAAAQSTASTTTSTDNEESDNSIYDTSAYHQPLAHPAKKHHSWTWIVWIVLILLVGVAGGAGVYYLGLI